VEVTVNDHRVESRYEARLGTELVGVAEYELGDSVIVFPHTEVEPEHRGQGIARTLARYALDDARRRGLSVVPHCSFIRHFIATHPDYADLVG
jgi:predicted GNAT family acetyltransferase